MGYLPPRLMGPVRAIYATSTSALPGGMIVPVYARGTCGLPDEEMTPAERTPHCWYCGSKLDEDPFDGIQDCEHCGGPGKVTWKRPW